MNLGALDDLSQIFRIKVNVNFIRNSENIVRFYHHVLFILEECWNINETRVLVCSVVVLLLLKMFIHIFTPTTCVIVTRKELLQLFISSVIFQQNSIFKHGGNREC